MSIADRYFKEGDFTILTKAAGCQDGLQLGLSSNGLHICLLYTSPSPRDDISSRMPSSA